MNRQNEPVRVGHAHLALEREALSAALSEMVRIPSINPDLVPGAAGERAGGGDRRAPTPHAGH